MSSTDEIRERIQAAVITHLKEHGELPKSCFALCKSLNLSEKDFYGLFPSLEAVESGFWRQMLHAVIHAVQSGQEWNTFSAKQRLLTFFYAFFESAMDHRSLLLLRFAHCGIMDKPVFLREFEATFKEFTRDILREGVATREVADRGRLQSLYPDSLYLMFRGVIDFNLRDGSPGFEKTDALIEKSVTLAFDLLRTSALESAFDLARMILPHVGSSCHSRASSHE